MLMHTYAVLLYILQSQYTKYNVKIDNGTICERKMMVPSHVVPLLLFRANGGGSLGPITRIRDASRRTGRQRGPNRGRGDSRVWIDRILSAGMRQDNHDKLGVGTEGQQSGEFSDDIVAVIIVIPCYL